MTNIFISHSSQDRQASNLAKELEKYGLDIWISKQNIRGGQKWEKSIKQGIRDCDFFVIVLSSNSVVSSEVIKEFKLAFNHNKIIIPVVVESIDSSVLKEGLWKSIELTQQIDLVENWESGIRKILSSVRGKIEVFIAHATEDTESAKTLSHMLSKYGFKPWLAKDIHGGREWQEVIAKKIEHCNVFTALFSEQSIKKESFFQEEYKQALENYVKSRKRNKRIKGTLNFRFP